MCFVLIYIARIDTVQSIWIDSERQVSSLMVICFILICIVSHTFQSAIDMTIDNRCSNIELVSPIYFIKDTMLRMHFPQQVDSKSKMKVSFRTGMNRSTFGGVLLYYLQRKENEKPDDQSNADKDISISTQLLVIWGCISDKIYSRTWLVEHENTLSWDENKLERLYYVYAGHYEEYSDIDPQAWLLDDNIMLKIEREALYGEFKIEIIISEEKDQLCPQKPLWIDSNR
jgi:hypothetical protein